MFESFSPIVKIEPPKEPEFSSDFELNETVKSVFESKGIKKLYKHQAEAISLIRKGKNIVVCSPTASGKTEIYLSEVVSAALEGKTSLILYPTKALSRDQFEKFKPFKMYGVNTAVYDGDTTESQKKKIRQDNPHVLITNIDMLHHILLHNRSFRNFFNNLKFIVLDEVHIYSGILGSHTANILWRAKRIVGRPIQLIATSATIKNAKSFVSAIYGELVEEVSGNSSKRSKIFHYIIPPNGESYLTTTIKILSELDKKCLIFGNSHSAVEKLALIANNQEIPVHVYRGGLEYNKRKEIEEQFKEGKIKYLATTSALELGVDIGDVECVILSGYPGTLTRTKQRIGRAGRKEQDAYAIFVAKENPLDQYFIENIQEYFDGEPENCFVEPNNKNVKKIHITAAARDQLLKEEEVRGIGGLVSELEKEGSLKKWGKFYSATSQAWQKLNLLNIRGIGENIEIFDAAHEGKIGERALPFAMNELFEGALYLHGGKAYISERLDLKQKKAFLVPLNGETDYLTLPLKDKKGDLVEEISKRELFGYSLSYGKMHVVDSVYGFRIKDIYSGKILGETKFKSPYEYEFDTYGTWLDLEDLAIEMPDFGDGLHGFEHVFIAMSSSITGADPKEVGGLSYSFGKLFIYDSVSEGNGVTKIIYDHFENICKMSYNRLKNCKCEKGCPKCILDPMCGNDNRFLNKEVAVEIAEKLVGSI